jgi:hypothetical protein
MAEAVELLITEKYFAYSLFNLCVLCDLFLVFFVVKKNKYGDATCRKKSAQSS